MIPLTRDRTRVPGGLRGHHLRTKNLKLLKLKRQKGTLVSDDFKKTWWKPAKKRLKDETHGKCAYCEAPVAAVAHGDVEHYRPKNKYWWLAYCYDNYLYSCQICNQTYKSNHFPRSGPVQRGPRILSTTPDSRLETLKASLTPDPVAITEGYTLAAFHAKCDKEQPDLLDPYHHDPASLIAFEAREVEQEVWVVPVDNDARSQVVVQAMHTYYGLNRQELLKLRWPIYKMVRDLRDDYLDPQAGQQMKDRKRGSLHEAMAAESMFAGMIRYFVLVEWQLDVPPPL